MSALVVCRRGQIYGGQMSDHVYERRQSARHRFRWATGAGGPSKDRFVYLAVVLSVVRRVYNATRRRGCGGACAEGRRRVTSMGHNDDVVTDSNDAINGLDETAVRIRCVNLCNRVTECTTKCRRSICARRNNSTSLQLVCRI